jgi:hypothetical protein
MNIPWLNDIFTWIRKQSESKFYPYILTIILVFMSLLFATPKYNEWLNRRTETNLRWEKSISKSGEQSESSIPNKQSPGKPSNIKPVGDATGLTNHELSRKVFRITVPLVIKVLRLKPMTTYLVRFLLGVLLIFLFYRLSDKILHDPAGATFVTAGLVFIYFGRACFVDGATNFNGWAFLFLILTLLYKNPLLIFSFSTLAAWTDERAFLALPIVMIFHQVNSESSEQFEWKKMVRLKPAFYSGLAAIIGYIIIRFLLSTFFHFNTPGQERIATLFYFQLHNVGFGLWSFFEGFWLLFLIVFALALLNRHYLILSAIVVQMAGMIIVVYSDYYYDVTHSGSFLVPIIFIFLLYLRKFMNRNQITNLLFMCMFFCFIFPANYLAGGGFQSNQPILIEYLYHIATKL